MKSRIKLSVAAGAVLLSASTGAWLGCQSYEADPVKPAAAKVATTVTKVSQKKSPNVVLVVDRSGSMSDDPTNAPVPACQTGAGQHGTGCKWDELLRAMTGSGAFIDQLSQRGSTSDPVRIGLVTFSGAPDPGASTAAQSCSAGALRVPPQAGGGAAAQTTLNGIVPTGGTPTTASMDVAAASFGAPGVSEAGRSNYIVLLTDGAPNCNSAFQATLSNCKEGTERCQTQGGCIGVDPTTGNPAPGPFAPLGCLDEENLVTKIKSLHDSGIATFVIGFGADFGSGSLSAETLERSAQAGGVPQQNPDGGSSGVTSFYQATDATQLKAALAAIVQQIGSTCDYPLQSQPASASAVQVIVTPNGQPATTLNSNQWKLSADGVQIVDDALCNSIVHAPPDQPTVVSVNFLSKQ